MEFIIPLLLLFILSVMVAAVAARTTKSWTRGRAAAIVFALFCPGLYVAYVLGVGHLRDDYHRRRSETYNFDGNCVVALGHGYKLEFYDEFPEYSTITLESSKGQANYSDDGIPVRLLENGVQRVGVASIGVYGGASGRTDWPGEIDHYFFLSFTDGSNKRFKTEGDLRSAVPGVGSMDSPEGFFSTRESKERSTVLTWILFAPPILIVALGWRWVSRRQSIALPTDQSLVTGATQG